VKTTGVVAAGALLCVLPCARIVAQHPGLPLDRLTPALIDSVTDRDIGEARAMLERLLRQRGRRTVANTLRPYDDVLAEAGAARIVRVLRGAHPDSAVRAACARAEEKLNAFTRERRLDPRVYAMLRAIDTTPADAEARYYIREQLAVFRRDGVDRDDTTRARLAALQTILLRLQQTFEGNIQADSTAVTFASDTELAGMPPDWVAERRAGPHGEIVVRGDDLMALWTQAASRATRARAMVASFNRAPANGPVLDSMLRTRATIAALLGYRSWADYQLAGYMAGSPDSVRAFLDALRRATDSASPDTSRAGGPPLSPVALSDYTYERVQGGGPAGRGALRGGAGAALRPYFPYPQVRDGLFALAHEYLGLEFRPAPDLPGWHPTVEAYRVYDGGRLTAIVYLDVHLRPGRTSVQAAATHGIRSGVRGRTLAEAAITAGVVRDVPADPGLMGPMAVVTLFHEFGHLVHFVIATRAWSWTSGLPPEGDFREVPSTLFEQWARDTTVLRRIARHYQTGAPAPDSLLARMTVVPPQGAGFALQWRARMSLELHAGGRAPENTDSVVRAAFGASRPRGVDLRLPDAEIHPENYFWHLSTYEASYYTYLWSSAIAQDILSQFAHGLLDTALVHKYRREILEPGGSRSAMESVQAFLGRPFTLEAWARAQQ
jgi:Zn-dependent oligopeptidase